MDLLAQTGVFLPKAEVRVRNDRGIPLTENGQALSRWISGYPDQWSEHVPELQWPASVRTYERMSTDAQVAGVLRAIIGPVLGASWALDPQGAPPEIVEFVSKALTIPTLGQAPVLRPPRGALRFNEILETALTEALKQGHSIWEQVYEPTIEPTTSNLLLRLKTLGHRPANTIHRWDIALDGGLAGVTQFHQFTDKTKSNTTTEVYLGIERLVVWCFGRKTGDWTGTSILRAAWKPWFLKDQALRIGMIGLERAGVGVPVVRYPGDSDSDRQRALDIASAVRAGEDAGVALGTDWELTLQGIEGGTVDARPWIDYFDQQIAKSMLAMFMDLGHDAGARSLGDTFTGHFVLFLNHIREWVETVVTEFVIRDLVEINFGPGALYPLVRAPRLEAEQSVTPQLIGELLTAGVLSWTPELEVQVRQMLRLTPQDEATLVAAHDKAVSAAARVTVTSPSGKGKQAKLSEGQQPLFGTDLDSLQKRLDSLR